MGNGGQAGHSLAATPLLPSESKAGCGVIYGFGEGWQALAAVTISRVT